jgi:CDP-glucose 4,6-dehydratase
VGGLVAEQLTEVFQGKRVLVTGHTGFKGSWLALWLHMLGAEVVGLALPPENADDHFNLLGLERLIHHNIGDIRDKDLVDSLCKEFQPEFLFHLAAQPLVRYSYDEPKLTFDTNVGGSVNVLEAVRNSPSMKALIYVTSDKCYKNKEWLWGYRENDELGGHDPYSASKAAAELIFSSYMDSFFSMRAGMGAASVRAGNVIGGGDWAKDRIVPDCIRALRAQLPIEIRNPSATRPWQHVLEPLSGYIATAAKLYASPKEFSGAWNFGPDDESVRTVKALADQLIACWGGGTLYTPQQQDAPHEANLLHLNCDKAKRLLGWRSRWDFTQGVAETVRWYRDINDGGEALMVSRQQISNFMEAMND